MKRSTIVLYILSLGAGAVYGAQWQAAAPQSRLTFNAVQAGAEFQGQFKQFTANVTFDPAKPTECQFDVTIATTSVDTQDAERDDTLKSADLFDAKRFPQSRYLSKGCTARGQQFMSNGKLTLRNVTRDVPITFTFDGKTLKGSAQVKRLDFGVGQGDWKDTEWVANEVKVGFVLQPKS
ncbi:MAG TPA: YceI family protein [Steroidobacteraceae bacterium]|nr:YceI family protein [Steroidobacteraceae bacterium]